MPYLLDRLGWLQFQQLCTRLLELDAGVPAGAWSGAADRIRVAHVESGVGPPLVPYRLPGPILVRCAWHAPGAARLGAAQTLAREQAGDLLGMRSMLLIVPAELESSPAEPILVDHLRLAIVGASELSARIDAVPQLRLQMPSLLGIRGGLEPLIAEAVAERSSLDLDAARVLARVFAPTRAHARALEVLAEHRFAVLTGPPEMGKTAIARMVALALMTDGWEAHECTSPDDVWAAFDPAASQVFVADDAFGSTEYRADAAERWAVQLERLLRSLDDRHWLIWTSRPAPLHAALRRLHRERGAERFPSPARVLVDAGALDAVEKTLILFRHAKAGGLHPQIRRELRMFGAEAVADPHFTPERIRRLIEALRRGELNVVRAIDHELATPTEAMATSLHALGDEHRALLVALLDVAPGPASERDLVASLRRHHEGALSRPPGELVDRLADHFLRVMA